MTKRVMVVDDSRLVKVQPEDALKGTDYEIAAHCRSGEDAIEQYASIQPDLVTIDIIMQGMDGLDAAGELCLYRMRAAKMPLFFYVIQYQMISPCTV